MTVETFQLPVKHDTLAAQSDYPFPGEYWSEDDLTVWLSTDAGLSWDEQKINVDFKVEPPGLSYSGGTVQRINDLAWPDGSLLQIDRNTRPIQEFSPQLQAKGFETALDRLTMRVQELDADIQRTQRVSRFDDPIAPLPSISVRANTIQSYDSFGKAENVIEKGKVELAIQLLSGVEPITERITDFDTLPAALAAVADDTIYPAGTRLTYAGYKAVIAPTAKAHYPAGGKIKPAPDQMLIPELFEAVGDGINDDDPAVAAWLEYGEQEKTFLYGRNGARYLVKNVIVGHSEATSDILGLFGNGATFVASSDVGATVDLVGFRNSSDFKFQYWYITAPTGINPPCGLLLGRPDTPSGAIRSAGGASISFNRVTGTYRSAAFLSFSSESNTVFDNTFVNLDGMSAGVFSDDPFINTFKVSVAGAAGDFGFGETISSAGGSTATVISWEPDTHRIWARVIAGTFAKNDVITGATTAATGTIDDAVFVEVKPSIAHDIEFGSTSSFYRFLHNRLNTSGDKLVPAMAMGGHTDFLMKGTSINHNGKGTLFEWTGFGVAFGGFIGLKMRDNYLHSQHEYSMILGDRVRTDRQNLFHFDIQHLSAGVPSRQRIAIFGNEVVVRSSDMRTNGDVVFGPGVSFQGSNKLEIATTSAAATNVKIEGSPIDMHMTCPLATQVDFASAGSTGDRLRIDYMDASFKRLPAPDIEVITNGEITIRSNRVRIDTEGGAAADDLETINIAEGALIDGDKITIWQTSSSRDVKLVRTGNIRNPIDIPIGDARESKELQYEDGFFRYLN